MIKLITIDLLQEIVKKIGLKEFFLGLIATLEKDFSRWPEFKKSPRHATHFPQGVIELMPICDDEYYAFKYVNGHPQNSQQKKLTVVALGVLADAINGYPLMISEMTLLTAFRTAATNALATKYLARKDIKTLAIIGTGAQSEFLVLAHYFLLGIREIRFFDIDARAMEKFSKNLAAYPLHLVPCENIQTAIQGSDVIITNTADKRNAVIVKDQYIVSGMHINGVGGDCPGKTELDPLLLPRCKIVVEFIEQTKIEGEIQNLQSQKVYAELWEIISGKKDGRFSAEEITLFDCTGFALEDYSALRWIYKLSDELQIGDAINLIPHLQNPKDLFELVQ